jgi:SRSO17 transposase
MDLRELRSLRPALERYVRRFDGCIKTRNSRRHLRTYVRGQLGPLPRKSIEPIALDAHVPPRTLQEFLSIHRWDDAAVGRRLRGEIQKDHPHENAIAVIDETSYVKCGPKTPGVQRQHCGAVGKVENCVVTVHLGRVAGDSHALLEGDLYLPESWADDFDRRREAHIPDDVVYRPKWRIALDLLHRSLEEGVEFRWLTADEEYGRVGPFRDAVEEAGLLYVVEIPTTITGWTKRPRVVEAGFRMESGRRLKHPRVAPGERRARPVSALWRRGGPSWQDFRVKDSEKGPVVWRVRETPFYPARGYVPGNLARLLIAEEVVTGEVKYFLTCAPAEVPLKEVLTVAFSRWHIEKLFKEGKGEVGLDQFEVRSYRSLMRHLTLTNVSLYFLAEQTGKLRGEKPGVDDLSGAEGGGAAVGPGDAPAGTDASTGEARGEVRVHSPEEPPGGTEPPQIPASKTEVGGHRSASRHTMPPVPLALYY